MPEKNLKPKRVQLRSYGPLANVGHPPEEIEALIPIYQQIGIGWVDDQIADGPNRGYHELWQQAGFSFYCNRGFSLSAYSYDDRTASTNLADYAVGLDGTTTRGVAWQCYHGRIWCPIAIMTPGRYPFELMRKVIDEGVQSGVTMFDADLEIHPWSHCFCKNCLQQFADFAGLLPQQLANLENSEIILTYPDTWYTFRCEQTRRFYANLRNHAQLNYPGVQVGSDTVLQHLDQDFGNLRHGFCMFAEDPRLLDNTVDYFLADTLSGSVYDCIAVDAMHRTTTKPIISVAGSSYCVGFNPMVMAGRRMTANLTGDRYGYERRADLLKLGMVHQIASGAAGVRFEINEISVAAKAAEAADILARAEDYYLDGRRCDSEVEIYNLTAESSPWLKDRSRIGGRMWLHFYNKVGEGGRYTAHTTTNALLVSLFNWDHHQEKKWLVRLPPRLAQEYHLIELATQTTITPANAVSDTPWPVNELTQGIPITVPAAGLKVLLFTTQKPAGSNIMHLSAAELEAAREQSKKCRPFDPLQWYKGEQFDIKKAAKNGVDLALERLNLK